MAGDRNLVAFGQHFSVHWVAWTGNNLNPNTNWVEIMELNFGSAQSMLEAFSRNPSAFLKHIGYNLLDLIKVSKLFFPAIYPKSKLTVGVGGVLIVGLLVAYLANNHFNRLLLHVSKIRENLPDYKGLLILVGLFLPPGLISMIIIYPHDRYVWLPIVLTLVTLTILLTEHDFEPMQMNLKQYLPLGLLVFVLISSFFLHFRGVQRPIFSTIRFIQSLGIHDAVNLLEAEGGYDTYLGDNFQRVAEYDKDTGFNQFRTNFSINMIVMSSSLRNDSRFIDDPEWQDFLTDYHELGYLQMEIPNTDNKLIILADLLQK